MIFGLLAAHSMLQVSDRNRVDTVGNEKRNNNRATIYKDESNCSIFLLHLRSVYFTELKMNQFIETNKKYSHQQTKRSKDL